jgi:hypothetical protein
LAILLAAAVPGAWDSMAGPFKNMFS